MNAQKRKDLIVKFKQKLSRPLRYYLDLCSRCGLCYDTCHVYQGIPKKEYSPVGRAEVVRRIYKKYLRTSGWLFPYWGDAKDIDDAAMEELLDAAFSCTGCRRCMIHCPFGIDTPMILSVAKALLIENGTAPEELVILTDGAVEKGESIDEFKEGYRSIIRDLEKEVSARINASSSEGLIPLEKKGADILFVGLAGAHSIVNPAIIFNKAGVNWTLSWFEAVNFGAFLGDSDKMHQIANRIIKEATNLGVKEVVIVECGTAYRIPKFLLGPLPFAISSIVEVIHRLWKNGRLKIK